MTATVSTTSTTPVVVDEPDRISFEFAGLPVALLRTEKKDESGHYYAFRLPGGKYTGFGTQIGALSDELPTSATVDGQEFALEAGFTASEKKDRTTGVVTKVTPRPKVSFVGDADLPSLGKRTVKVIVSVTKSGDWNVNATVTKVHSVSPEDRAKRANEKAQSNLAAILAALGQG
jgi:hypothetical protein